MVEIEIGVPVRQCLDCRLGDLGTLRKEVRAWNRERNERRARIRWLFDIHAARAKMARAYPQPRPYAVADAA